MRFFCAFRLHEDQRRRGELWAVSSHRLTRGLILYLSIISGRAIPAWLVPSASGLRFCYGASGSYLVLVASSSDREMCRHPVLGFSRCGLDGSSLVGKWRVCPASAREFWIATSASWLLCSQAGISDSLCCANNVDGSENRAQYGDSADLSTLARAIRSAVSFQPDRRPRQSRYGLELPPLEIVPLNSPVSVKKTGLLEASLNMGVDASVKVRTPVAPWKRPVPPVTWKVRVHVGLIRREIDAIASVREIDRD